MAVVKPVYHPWVNRRHALAPGLVAAWPLIEGPNPLLRDLVGHNHGTLTGSTNWAEGDQGPAITFGSGASTPEIDVGPAALLKALAASPFSVFVRFNSVLGSVNDILIGNGWSTAGWHIRVSSTNAIRFARITDGSNLHWTDTGVLAAGWHTVVGTWDGTTLRTYLDGVLSSTPGSAGTTIAVTSTLNTRIGNVSGQTLYFQGTMDAVYLWQTALSARDAELLHYDPYAMFRDPEGWLLSLAVSGGGGGGSGDGAIFMGDL